MGEIPVEDTRAWLIDAGFRLIGFEELGNNDAFTTATLELRLAVSGKFGKAQ